MASAFWFVYNINSESFPPLFVPFSLSVCSFVSRVITIASPQVAEIEPEEIPVIIFIAISGLNTFAVLFLRKDNSKKAIRKEEIEKNSE